MESELSTDNASSKISIAAYDSFDPLFNSLNPLLSLGSKRPLENSDIGLLREEDSVESSERAFQKLWDSELLLPLAQRSLRRAIVGTLNWCDIGLAVVLYLVFSASSFAGPLILKALLDHLSGKNELPNSLVIGMLIAIFLAPMIGAICKEQAELILDRLAIQIRNALIAVVFRKSLRLSPVARQANSGTINNIFANDTKQLADAVMGFPLIFAPISVAIGLYLIYLQVGAATFSGIGYVIAVMPLLIFFGARFGILVKRKLIHSDARVKLTNEIFSGIRVLKYYAWEKPFASKLEAFRSKEIVEIAKIYINFIFLTLVIESLPTVQPVLIYYTYTRLGNELTYTTAFTTLTLFLSIQGPLTQIPSIFTLVAYVVNATDRILNLLNAEEIEEYRQFTPCSDNPEDVIILENASFAWLKDDEISSLAEVKTGSSYELAPIDDVKKNDTEEEVGYDDTPGVNRGLNTITNASFRVPCGSLVGILGSVGSGKSSLLAALLGEVYLTGGSVRVVGSTSYHQQQPWILNMSLKDNVLFGLPYDETKFNAVIEAAALIPDLASLPLGADTEIGEKGITLSGGQKARVSFARALYRDADITLLDDPLSAVDAHTCEHLWSKGIKGMLKDMKKTTLIVTHQVHLLSDCDLLIILGDDGNIKRACSYNELSKQELDDIFYDAGTENEGSLVSWFSASSHNQNTKTSAKLKRESKRDGESGESGKKDKTDSGLMEKEDRQIGFVPLSVYKWFVRTGGVGYIIGMAVVIFVARAVNASASFYLSYWGGINADAQAEGSEISEERNLKYLNNYACIVMSGIGIGTVGRYLASRHAVEIGTKMHSAMLNRVLGAPISFFDTTPLGRIINRFTGDMGTADMGLSAFLGIIYGLICDLILSFVAIAISTKGILLVVLLPLGLLYYYVQLYFRKSNTEIRRLGSIAKSPVFTQITQALSGTSCIRAFEEQSTFVKNMQDRMNQYASIFLIERKMNSWIFLRIQFLGASIAFFVVLLAIYGDGFVTPEALAVALTYCFIIPVLFGVVLAMGAEMEAMMSSVERIQYFTGEIPREEELTPLLEMTPIPSSWPSKGCIEARDITMRYRNGPQVLKNISFEIKGGEKVGLAGRTGSGKSSLLVALFRMEKLEEGKILIDDIDVSKIGIETLRSRLSIIPQDPVMFSETVRFNLDPFDQYTDEEIWGVLEDVHMKQAVKDMPLQLHAEIAEDGDNLSVGQRQLVCFARALLRKPKIVVLDEATAAVDNATDAIIQKMVKEKLKDCTMLTIAHRLHTILDSDKIMVLDKGNLVEEDTPNNLISKWNGVFASMWAQHQSSHHR